MPSSRMAADKPAIPTDLEHQVGNTVVTVAQETVTPVMEKEDPMGTPPIETRTVGMQGVKYATIDMRILNQLGRLEVADQSLAKLVQRTTQPEPTLEPASVPGMMEVELVQMAQATTSQAAPSAGSQGTTGSELSNNQKTQGKGHGKRQVDWRTVH